MLLAICIIIHDVIWNFSISMLVFCLLEGEVLTKGFRVLKTLCSCMPPWQFGLSSIIYYVMLVIDYSSSLTLHPSSHPISIDSPDMTFPSMHLSMWCPRAWENEHTLGFLTQDKNVLQFPQQVIAGRPIPSHSSWSILIVQCQNSPRQYDSIRPLSES